MDSFATPPTTALTWANVCLGLTFILFNVLTSSALHLGVGSALLTSAFRCIVQLTLMGLVLQRVFETNNPWIVGGIASALIFMATLEAVTNKSKKRYNYMFLSIWVSMLCSTVPVSVIGTRYAMAMSPFWRPDQYIPMLGMLCGNAISGVVVAVVYILKEIHDNSDKVETYLAFGASRFEACLPIAREALRLALTPTINQMSVIGIIAMPGMMTGAILGGSPVEQAVKLQIVTVFMLSASTALAVTLTSVATLSVVVDGEHRVRPDRINVQEHPVWRARDWVLAHIVDGAKHLAQCCLRRQQEHIEWELLPRHRAKNSSSATNV